jgi:hypothetical protein
LNLAKIGSDLNINIRDTHYISPDSNLDKTDVGGFNIRMAGNTSLGQTNTMVNLNATDNQTFAGVKSNTNNAYGSSSNLMNTIPQFPDPNQGISSQKSNGNRTLKIGSDQNLAPAITQVTINRVNNLELQKEDTNLNNSNETSSRDQSAIKKKEEQEQLVKPFKLLNLNIDTNDDMLAEEADTFKSAKDAEEYYKIFQKTMNNIS